MSKNHEDREVEFVNQQAKEPAKRAVSQIRLLAGLIIVVCIAVAVAHWPALSAQALSFDDSQYLTENVLVQNPGWTSARRFLTEVLEPSTVGGYYQPLTMISVMVDYALGGREKDLMPFHRTSLLLHMANTALIIVLLYLLFGQVWPAAAAGLLFGVHPMTVEPIPWVGERKTLLAAFFALWCLVLYVHYTKKNNWKFLFGSLLMYVLALMSKPTSTPLPVLMLLMDYWPLRRLNKKAILEKISFFVVGGIFAVITYISQSRTAAVTLPSQYGPKHIPLILCHNIIFYLHKIIWPVNLSSHYAFPELFVLPNPAILVAIIGTCILVPLLVVSLRWTRSALTGWLFFFVAILPTSQIIGFSNVIASDKFAYLPSVGLLMILAFLLIRIYSISETIRPVAKQVIIGIIVLVVACAETVATRRYLVHWQDSISLYKYMLALAPDAAPLYNNLGVELQAQGKLDEADSYIRRALQLGPDNARAHNNLGIVLIKQGKLDEAFNHFTEALKLKPEYGEAYYNLGMVFKSWGRIDEATSCFRKVLQIKPDYAGAHVNLGIALGVQGKFDEAIGHFSQAIQLNPNDAKAHYNMGFALQSLDRFDEAAGYFRQALQVKPDYVAALNAMVRILTTHPDPRLRSAEQAIVLAERAAKLTDYQDASVLDTLAAAYAAAGLFDQAVTTAQTALKLAAVAQNEELTNRIRRKVKLYEEHKTLAENGGRR